MYGLAVGDLGFARGRLDLNSRSMRSRDDVEMQFAHAGKNGLAGVLVGLDASVGPRDKALEAVPIFPVGLGIRLDGHRDDRSGKDGGSRRMSKSSSHRVSPVMTSLTPTTAQMSPE